MTETATRIDIVLNGVPIATGARTLAVLIAEAGYGDARVATAVNGEFVAAGLRAGTRLRAGDHVEIVSPRQGG
ncbi:MAG: sulfur carrier protein ThiS [Hyphomicrobiaceae bacterium]